MSQPALDNFRYNRATAFMVNSESEMYMCTSPAELPRKGKGAEGSMLLCRSDLPGRLVDITVRMGIMENPKTDG